MLTIYIADDEVWITIGLKKLIEKSSFSFQVIGEAANGVTALEDIRRLRPDVLLTDIRMPGLTGLELLEAITGDKSLSTQVVLISGYSDFDYVQAAIRLGARDYLLKPVKQEELNRILCKLQKELTHSSGKEISENSAKDPAVSPGILSGILSEMKTRYTENISLNELSEKYGLSSSHLSILIKKELGISFTEYITSKRLQKAKELLSDESLSIEEVANATGYHDYFYFTKVFKKTMGISPSKYRKELERA